jgi:hypothetical protein
MNLRCTYCQTPFSVGRMEKLAALQRMQAENLHHYDAFCPRCRRANSVSRERLEQFTPGWQEGLKTLEAEAAQIEKSFTEPVPDPVKTEPFPAPVEASRNRHSHKAAAPVSVKAESKPAAKPAAKAKPAPAKAISSPKGKPAATKTKPAAKPSSKAKKPISKA